jgi:HAD superfamily hydrolase (TIGR01509 family)
MRKQIRYVIYDNDGLLLNTEIFYTEACQMITGRFGKAFDWSVKSKMIGKRASDSARILVDTLELPITPEEYLREREEIVRHLFPTADPLPGAVRLTMHLHRHGIPQAVATSSDQYHFELKITRHREWFRVFDTVVKGDDPAVKHGKPSPDLFLVAAERLHADPADCLVFEDAPSGTEAAIAAGMQVIAVPDPNMDHAEYPGAAQILDSLEEFDPAEWGLPPF